MSENYLLYLDVSPYKKLDYFVCRPGNGELWFLCVPKSRVIKCRIRGENRAQILTEELDSLPSPTSSSFQPAVPSGDLCNANPPTTPNSSGHWLWLPHRYLRWDVGPISNLHLSCFRASVFCERTDFDVFWWHHFLPVSHHTYLSFFSFFCVCGSSWRMIYTLLLYLSKMYFHLFF